MLVQERMTLKHKNTGKWAKRMLSRGPNVKYDGTKAAIAEQLQMNANLSRQMNYMRDGCSSDERDDEEELRDGSDEDTPSRLIAKAKEKTLKALKDDELPNAVLMSLPFMVIFVFCFLITNFGFLHFMFLFVLSFFFFWVRPVL